MDSSEEVIISDDTIFWTYPYWEIQRELCGDDSLSFVSTHLAMAWMELTFVNAKQLTLHTKAFVIVNAFCKNIHGPQRMKPADPLTFCLAPPSAKKCGVISSSHGRECAPSVIPSRSPCLPVHLLVMSISNNILKSWKNNLKKQKLFVYYFSKWQMLAC